MDLQSNTDVGVANYYIKRNNNYRKRYYAKCKIAYAIAAIVFAIWVNVHLYYLIKKRNELRNLKKELMIQVNQTKSDIEGMNYLIEEKKIKVKSYEGEIVKFLIGIEYEEIKRQIEEEKKTLKQLEDAVTELQKIKKELISEQEILDTIHRE